MLLYVIIAIAVATLLAMVITALLQKRMRRKWLQLEISNQGNVPTQYLLRPEVPDGRLAVQFSLEGERLAAAEPLEMDTTAPGGAGVAPQPAAEPAAARKSAGQKASRAVGITGLVADLLTSVGWLLPRSISGPLLSAGSRLRGVEMTAIRAQQVPGKIGNIKGQATGGQPSGGQSAAAASGAAPRAARAASRADVLGWLQTPPVFPGETLVIDLQLRPLGSSRQAAAPRTFQIASRPVSQAGQAAVLAHGSADFTMSFWARLLPYLIILAAAALSLLLVGGLASLGLLAI